MTKRSKKRIFNCLRLVLCIGALWIVIQGVTFRDHVTLRDGTEIVGSVQPNTEMQEAIEVEQIDGQRRTIAFDEIAVDEQENPLITYGLATAWRESSKLLLLLAIAMHFPVLFPQALRFQWMLRAQEITVGYCECVKLSLAGNFLNFATPLGSNAGDVFKAYFVSLHTDRKTEAATTVLLDRFVGLGSLLLVMAFITTLAPSDSPVASFSPYVLSLLGMGVVCGLIYLSPMARRYLVPRSWIQRLPMIEQLQRVDTTARVLARRKGTLIGAILLTVFLQALAIGAYFVTAIAMGLEGNASNVLDYYTYFYTGVLIQTLPGPPQGLGTVELAYRFFLAPFGSPSQIICMAAAIRIIVLICALPGLFITMVGAYRPRDTRENNTPSHDVQAEDRTDHGVSQSAAELVTR